MSYRAKAKPNEVWQDADGCCYTPHPYQNDAWLAFGTDRALTEADPLVTLPMVRLILENGDLDYGWENPRRAPKA